MNEREKRKYARINQNVVITYEPDSVKGGSGSGEFPAWLDNLSVKGAALEIDRRFELGTPMVIQIPFIHENEMNDTLFVNAEIRWVRPYPEGSSYEVGIEFVSVPKAHERMLQDFMHEHEASNV